MTNANKIKGDVFERAVLAVLHLAGLDAVRTRAGYERDHGDLHVGRRLGRGPQLVVQCKAVRAWSLGEWLAQLAQQRGHAEATHGVVVVKRRQAATEQAYAVMELHAFVELLRAAQVGTAGDITCSCCGGDPATVCDACGEHSCWAGIMYCEDAGRAGSRQAVLAPSTP